MTLVVTSPVNNALKCDSEVVDTSTDTDLATATGTDVYQGTHMTLVVAGPVSNALSVRYSCRSVVFAGGLLIGCGFVASAFVPSFNWLYLTYSILTGLVRLPLCLSVCLSVNLPVCLSVCSSVYPSFLWPPP